AAAAAPRSAEEKPAEEKAQANRHAERLKSMKKARTELAARSGRASGDRKAAKDAPARMDEADKAELFFDAEVDQRESLRQLYRKLDKTWEWAANNYHHLTIDQQNAALITGSAFWKDYAEHDPAAPFLSRHLAAASRNFPEMLMALAVLDLPFESPKHETKFEGAVMNLTTGGPVVIFH